MASAQRLAATGIAGFFIFFWLFAAPNTRRASAGEEKKAPESKPYVFKSALANGKKTAGIVLGKTTYEEVLKIFPAPPVEDYDGALRPAERAFEGLPSIKYVYNPWQTMNAIFFDAEKRAVMVSELYELGALTEKELLRKYPGMVESDSGQGSIEYQAELEECMSVIARVETAGRTVEQLSYAYTCE
ncbi:hypothetical protein BAC1_00020 [uncultured bacterium]|nr:hypothetical protein BAC1_00020 [uncultured bacterium]